MKKLETVVVPTDFFREYDNDTHDMPYPNVHNLKVRIGGQSKHAHGSKPFNQITKINV